MPTPKYERLWKALSYTHLSASALLKKVILASLALGRAANYESLKKASVLPNATSSCGKVIDAQGYQHSTNSLAL